MTKIYYARSMSIYGTPQELRDKRMISSAFTDAEIIQFPDEKLIQEWYKEYPDESHLVMEQWFYPLVERADVLLFRGMPGTLDVGAGVAGEVAHARSKGIPVFELPTELRRTMTVEETRAYLRETGQR